MLSNDVKRVEAGVRVVGGAVVEVVVGGERIWNGAGRVFVVLSLRC